MPFAAPETDLETSGFKAPESDLWKAPDEDVLPPTPEAIRQGLAGVAHAANLGDTATGMMNVARRAGEYVPIEFSPSGREIQPPTPEELAAMAEQDVQPGIQLPSMAPSRDQMRRFMTLSNPFAGPVTPETDPTGLVRPPEWLTSAATGAVEGVDTLGRGVVEFGTTPSGATQLASLATPLAPLTLAKFTYDMGKGAKEAAERAGTKFGEGDIQGGVAAATEALGLAAGAKGSVGHLAKKLGKSSEGYVPRGAGIESPSVARGEPITAEPIVEPKSEAPLTESKAPEVISEAAKEIGAVVGSIGSPAIKLPANLESLPAAEQAMYKQMAAQSPTTVELTDKRAGSPTRGLTINPKVGATKSEVMEMWNKAKEGYVSIEVDAINRIQPAILIDGKPFTGKTHIDATLKVGTPEAIEAAAKAENQGFVFDGKFISREQASEMVGEKGSLTSERLNELRAALEKPSSVSNAQPGGPATAAGNVGGQTALPAAAPVEPVKAAAKVESEVKTVAQTEGVRPEPESPELVSMGGATPLEFQKTPQTPTGIKNAQVDSERAKRGLPPVIQPARRTFGKVWDEAMAQIDRDPGYPDRLISDLRDKPRALTDLEDATLLHRQIDLQNEYGKATRDLAQAFDDGRLDAVQNEKARVNALSDQLLDLYNVGKRVGTETGRGLAARKMMAYEDFTLAKMELEKRAVNDGKPLTDSQRAEVIRLNKRIEETQKSYDDYVSKTQTRDAERAIKDALEEVERKSRQQPVVEPHVKIISDKIKVYFDRRGDAALKRLQGKLFTISPQVLADLTDLGVSRILSGAAEFTGWSAKMVEALGDKVKPHLQTVWDSSQRALNAHVEKVAGIKSDKVKQAVKGTPIVEQITIAKDSITEKVNAGERNAIAPMAQKLARLFVEQGIKGRDALIDAVHGILKEADPTFTRRETMDAISGYGDFKQLTKDQISKELRDLKGQMQQVAKLEDMQAGRPPLKTGVERRIPSPEESRLIKLVNEAKNKFQIPIDNPNTQLKSSLDTLKTRLRNRTIELRDKLARGDFEKNPKRIIQMDAEANRLHLEAAKAKLDWYTALMKDRLAKRSIPVKIFAGIGEVLNTSRAILTSMDFSAVLRQGGFVALSHPVRAAKSFPAMFRAFASEAGQHAVNQQIIARKNYPLYNQGKLFLSEHGNKLSQMEEAYMSRWADKIPLVAGSQRAYVTFLNKLRADSFDAMANSLARGKELTPVEVNAIANFVNVATGRGNVGMKENALVGLNTVFFAPRYVASRFQLLAGQPLYRGTARTRVAVAKEYGRFLVGVAVVYALAMLDGAEVEQDPRSADFGKLRYGNTRLDPMAGLLQNTVLLSRLGSGETKASSGKVVPIRGPKVPFGSGNSADVIARFLRSKLSPAIGTGLNILTGKDVVGQPVTPASTAQNLLVPLSMQDIYAAMIEQGVPRGTAMAVLSIFGMGLQNYPPPKKK